MEENKENTEHLNKSLKKRQNKQILYAIVLMVLVILIIITVPYIMKNYLNKFSYLKLDFYKNNLGKITFYSTNIPLIDNNGKVVAGYSMDFRNDPRKLNYINVSISDKNINLMRDNITYVAISSNVNHCDYNTVAVANLASFLRGFARLNLKGASSDKEYANLTNSTYANCQTNPNNTVILIKSGNETKIEKTSKNCYELTYKECEVTQVTEKFDIVILESYMGHFTKK